MSGIRSLDREVDLRKPVGCLGNESVLHKHIPLTKTECIGKEGVISRQLSLRKPESLGNEDVISRQFTLTESLSNEGGTVSLSNLNVTLHIPKDALPPGDKTPITVTVDTNEKHPLSLKDDQLILGSVISCKPEGQKFLKPITLSIPHSGLNVNLNNLQVWCKQQEIGNTSWEKIYDGSQKYSQDGITVKVEKDKIKIRVNHFTLYDFITAPMSVLKYWFSKPELVLDILAYMYPANVTANKEVVLRVYALKKNDEANRRLVEETEKEEGESGMCSIPSTYVLEGSGKNLLIQFRNIRPQCVWLPVDTMKGIILYQNIQNGALGSRCEVRFCNDGQADRLAGSFNVEQEGNSNVVEGVYFDDNMAKKKVKNNALPEIQQGCFGASAASKSPEERDCDRHHTMDSGACNFSPRSSYTGYRSSGRSLSHESTNRGENQGTKSLMSNLVTPSMFSSSNVQYGAGTAKGTSDCGPFLKRVAMRIHPNWRDLAKSLGFTSEQQHEFEKNPFTVPLQWWPAYKMLLAWKTKLPPGSLANLTKIVADVIRPLDPSFADEITGENASST